MRKYQGHGVWDYQEQEDFYSKAHPRRILKDVEGANHGSTWGGKGPANAKTQRQKNNWHVPPPARRLVWLE